MKIFSNKKEWQTLRDRSLELIKSAEFNSELRDDYQKISILAKECDSWIRIREAVRHKLRTPKSKNKYPHVNADITRCTIHLNDCIGKFHDHLIMLRLKMDIE